MIFREAIPPPTGVGCKKQTHERMLDVSMIFWASYLLSVWGEIDLFHTLHTITGLKYSNHEVADIIFHIWSYEGALNQGVFIGRPVFEH